MIIRVSQILLSSLLILSSLFINPAYSVPLNDKQKISEHLEFFGFKSSMDGDSLKATSSQHFPIYLNQTDYGIRFNLALSVNAKAAQNKAKLMDILNALNAECRVIKFYLDQGDIVFESLYIGDYNRQEFGAFIQAYLSDYDVVYKNSELSQYIGN